MWHIKLEISSVVKNYIQQILGVNKRTSVNGILSECGKFPLCMRSYIQIIRYWIRLHTDNKYMQEIYDLELQKRREGKDSWLRIIEFLIRYVNYNISDLKKEENNSRLIKFQEKFERKIKEKFKQSWNKELNKSFNESKMEFLCEYKRNFKFETYIDNLNFENRKTVCKFRLSNHKLPIEELRYDNIKRVERLCPICDLKVIGDENHYMLWCPNKTIQEARDNFICNTMKIAPELQQLNYKNIIKYCMHMGDPKLHYVTARYIDDLLNIYNIENEKIINNKYL